MELLSGVQERLTERLGPLKAWLFPRQVYLQLEDEAITMMALQGRRIAWLERVPLPKGMCEDGDPIRIDALGDLLGDLFVERGFPGARVMAVLPPAASQMRLVRWPDGRWPDDPERILGLHEASLGLATPLSYLDLHLVDLPNDPPTSLVVTVHTTTLEHWIEVFTLAQVTLERMEASQFCVCRGLQVCLGDSASAGLVFLLFVDASRCSLLVLDRGVPVFERRLSGSDQPAVLLEDLRRCREFLMTLRPGDESSLMRLWIHGPGLRDESQARDWAEALHGTWEILDPLAQGWLVDASPAEMGLKPEGPALASIWGLAATEVTA